MIALRPRAPVERFSACSAMADNASGVKTSETLSISNIRAYCLVRAFFGSVRIAPGPRGRVFHGRHHGEAPDELGDEPVLHGHREDLARSSDGRRSVLDRISAPKPSLFPARDETMSSGPEGPPQMKRMFVVRLDESWCGCLRPAAGRRHGSLEDLEEGCCTPSPVRRVIDGFSALQDTLSISSM